jgi:hypothetical protein
MEFLILSYSAVLLFDILHDWFLIERCNFNIKHGLHAFFIAVVYLALAYIASVRYQVPLKDLISVWVVLPFVRWFVQDLGLNVLRELPFDYLGSGKGSAWQDDYLTGLNEKGINQWVIKFSALCLSLALASIIQIIF